MSCSHENAEEATEYGRREHEYQCTDCGFTWTEPADQDDGRTFQNGGQAIDHAALTWLDVSYPQGA